MSYRLIDNDTGKDIIETLDNLKEENNQLQSNWNSLREYIKNNSIYYNTSDGCQWVDQFKLLDKMNELEEGNKD
jgi:hypothetical protein